MPRQTGPKNISEAKIIASLHKHAAIISPVAHELGCDRTNIEQRIKRSARLQAVVSEINGRIEDLADGIIVDTLGRKDGARPSKDAMRMACWLKDYKRRGEGIRLRMELPGKGGADLPVTKIQVNISYGDANPNTEEGII